MDKTIFVSDHWLMVLMMLIQESPHMQTSTTTTSRWHSTSSTLAGLAQRSCKTCKLGKSKIFWVNHMRDRTVRCIMKGGVCRLRRILLRDVWRQGEELVYLQWAEVRRCAGLRQWDTRTRKVFWMCCWRQLHYRAIPCRAPSHTFSCSCS
jgi:hypothetical protein